MGERAFACWLADCRCHWEGWQVAHAPSPTKSVAAASEAAASEEVASQPSSAPHTLTGPILSESPRGVVSWFRRTPRLRNGLDRIG